MFKDININVFQRFYFRPFLPKYCSTTFYKKPHILHSGLYGIIIVDYNRRLSGKSRKQANQPHRILLERTEPNVGWSLLSENQGAQYLASPFQAAKSEITLGKEGRAK